MRTRLLGAALLVPIVAIGVWLGGFVWAALVATTAAIACRETFRLFETGGMRPTTTVGLTLAATLTLSGMWPDQDPARLVLALGVMAAFADQLRRPPDTRSARDWAGTVAVPAYVGTLLGFAVLTRSLDAGLAWCVLLVALVWTNDSMAYLGGRALGRRPLAPTISPKKTVEGALVATAATIAVSALAPAIARWVGGDAAAHVVGPAWAFALLGLAVSVIAPVGDLSKSFLKRQAGVKDSGNVIPGHGGLLDRTDSLMFAAPLVYAFARLLEIWP